MSEVINVLPKIIQYFVPGAIFILIFNFITYSKQSNNAESKYFIFKSMIVSYMLIMLSEGIIKILKNSDYLHNSVPIVLSIFLAYGAAKFYDSWLFDKVLYILKIRRTVHRDFWKDSIDFEKGTTIRFYHRNDNLIYEGSIFKVEEKDGNRNILIRKCKIYDKQGKCVPMDSEQVCIILNTADFNRIDVIYTPNSSKIKSR